MKLIEVIVYTTETGKAPFLSWESKLDGKAKAIVMRRIDRVRAGYLGDTKRLQGAHGVWELRIDYGPGYRVYFGKEGSMIVVLLAGGSKKSQARDIMNAQKYWLKHRNSQ